MYLSLKNNRQKKKFTEIVEVYPDGRSKFFAQIFKNSGDIKILNGWVYNFSDICHFLEEALNKSSSQIEIIILSPDSKYVALRAEEIGVSKNEVIEAITQNLTEIKVFAGRISNSERRRLRVYTANYHLKFSFYARGQKAFIGFVWPKIYAVHGPQIFIDGKNGHLGKQVWKYYESLDKVEVMLFEEKNASNQMHPTA